MYTAAFMECFHESSFYYFDGPERETVSGLTYIDLANRINKFSSRGTSRCLHLRRSFFIHLSSFSVVHSLAQRFSDTSELVNDIFSPDWLGTTSARHFINSLTDKFQFQWRFSTARKSRARVAPRAICHLSLEMKRKCSVANADKKFRRVNIFLPYLPAIRYRTMLLMSV